MLDVLCDHEDRVYLVTGAHACVLADEPAMNAQAVRLAQKVVSLEPGPWSEHVMGLALYRAGRFADAEARLMASLMRDPGWDYHVRNWVILAMVEHRLGGPGEARRWLERAERWVATRLSGRPGGVDRAIPENWHWRDGIPLHLQLREARALIGAALPDLPADVFVPDEAGSRENPEAAASIRSDPGRPSTGIR
jgi:hypothetical protein